MRRCQTLFIVLAIFLSCLSCETNSNRGLELIDYIPQNSETVFHVQQLSSTLSDFKTNELFKKLKTDSSFKSFKQLEAISKVLRPNSSSIVSIKKNGKIWGTTLITKAHDSIILLDSVGRGALTTELYKKSNIYMWPHANTESFYTTIDSTFLISTSSEILKSVIDATEASTSPYKRLYTNRIDSEFSRVFTLDHFDLSDSVTVNFANRGKLYYEIFPEGVTANGVILDRDSTPQLMSIFRGQVPQSNKASSLIPADALQSRVITYSDAELLQTSLQSYHQNSANFHPIFETSNEIASISLNSGNAVAIKSIAPETSMEEITSDIANEATFKEIEIYRTTLHDSLFHSFDPFIDPLAPSFVFQIDSFFVFTENVSAAEQMITAYKNNATLKNAPFYESTASEMSKASSFMVLNLKGNIDTWIAPFLMSKPSIVKNVPLSVLQLSYDRDFAHVNVVSKEANNSKTKTSTVSQLFDKKFDAPLLNVPQFFTNHRTKSKEIVVQDINNKLHLLSSTGKTLWKKQLDGPILGAIEEIDLLRNGKKQIAFVTEKTFYVLDRNGKEVTPFPKKYKNKITQPLSVFDYDNNRKYRFVIVQGKEVLMYDSKGKTVSGFTFKRASSNIVQSPKHIRMRTKDYILIPEKNGKLNILSRTGKERIAVKKNFDFSEIPVVKEGNNFIVITAKNSKEVINQQGKISPRQLDITGSYWYTINGKTKATLDDNLLRINGKLVELPFGSYSNPAIFHTNRGTYITVTDIQEKKVYAYGKDGKLLAGFPVYGISEAHIDRTKGQSLLLVATAADQIAVYSIQ